MQRIFPSKLSSGDGVRVVAPVKSMAIISHENREIANKRFEELGLVLTFGKHIEEIDDFGSSSIEARVEDLHDAFRDRKVQAILTVIGGFNSNQLLKYLDWDLIRNNPKVFCGYSDVTALNNAIFAKTGLVNYSGPHYSTFSQLLYFDYTLDYFKKYLFSEEPFEVEPSGSWSDDAWYRDQEDRKLVENQGWLLINEGKASGTLLGGNLCTFNLLQGTEYLPDLKDVILFLEDDEESKPYHFDRDLQSIIHLPSFSGVKGLVIGRFQRASEISNEILTQIVRTKRELANIPVIANVDFGHTDPKFTFPVGGEAMIEAVAGNSKITIVRH